MHSKTIICFSLVLALSFPTVVLTATEDSMATLEEIMAFLGYSKADGEKLLAGEIISRGRESGTERELSVTAAMLVRAPLAEVNKFIFEAKMYAVNKDNCLSGVYLGHSYNSLHESAAALPVKQGTIVLYGNRTSTDQVTGFGGGLKREIGRGMMHDDLVKLFKAYRISAEQGGKR